MNHIAHCFLSFGDEETLIGNFIGDFVKGNNWQQYSTGIGKGILLHRSIDAYTDQHAMTDRSVARIRPFAQRYGGPVTDVLYDHLLAIHWKSYTSQSFDEFSQQTYAALARNRDLMPARLHTSLPKMLAGDFLRGYTTREGMYFVMDRFSRRLPPGIDMKALLDHFFDQLDLFSEDFNGFFPDLIEHTKANRLT